MVVWVGSVLTTAALYSAYHAVRRSPFVELLRSSAPLNYEQAVGAQRVFAEAFQAAADDAMLPCRSAGRFVPFIERCI